MAKRLWFKIGLVGFLLWVVSWLVYTKILLGSTQQRQKASQFESTRQADIWFLGDSHPLLAVNPAYIKSSFNWATRSEYYVLSYYKLQHLLGHYPKPKMVILPLEGHSFSAQGRWLWLQHELDDPFWAEIIKPGMDSLTRTKTFLSWWMQARFFPFAGQYFKWKLFFQPESMLDSGGYFSDSTLYCHRPMVNPAHERARAHYAKYSAFDVLQWNFLNKIRDLCRQQNIRLIFIRYPISDAYFKAAREWENKSTVDNIIRTGLPQEIVWDHRFFFKDRPCHFSDPDHLNTLGAKVYSSYLNRQLEAMRPHE